jgi:DNA polymerase-3 subunit epsilon
MHDYAAPEGRPLSPTGIQVQRTGTLVDRTIAFLGAGPADSLTLAHDVLGIPKATPPIADRVIVALVGADPRVRQLADARWALADTREVDKRIEDCSFAVVDVEATGGRATKGDRVIEVAVVVLAGGTVEVAFEALVNPGRPVPRFVSRLTNISDAMLRDQPSFDDIADELAGAIAGLVFAAHNAQFDWRLIQAEMRRARGIELDGPQVCTLRLARKVVPHLKSRGLDMLTHYFGITVRGRHRATGDAVATAHLLAKLIDLAVDQGATTLADLQRLAQKRPRKRSALPIPMTEL